MPKNPGSPDASTQTARPAARSTPMRSMIGSSGPASATRSVAAGRDGVEVAGRADHDVGAGDRGPGGGAEHLAAHHPHDPNGGLSHRRHRRPEPGRVVGGVDVAGSGGVAVGERPVPRGRAWWPGSRPGGWRRRARRSWSAPRASSGHEARWTTTTGVSAVNRDGGATSRRASSSTWATDRKIAMVAPVAASASIDSAAGIEAAVPGGQAGEDDRLGHARASSARTRPAPPPPPSSSRRARSRRPARGPGTRRSARPRRCRCRRRPSAGARWRRRGGRRTRRTPRRGSCPSSRAPRRRAGSGRAPRRPPASRPRPRRRPPRRRSTPRRVRRSGAPGPAPTKEITTGPGSWSTAGKMTVAR